MRRALASAMVAMALLVWACADATPPVSGDLPGDRGSIEGPADAAPDSRSSATPDADAAADADAETPGDGG